MLEVPDWGLASWSLIQYGFLIELEVLSKFQPSSTAQSWEISKSRSGLGRVWSGLGWVRSQISSNVWLRLSQPIYILLVLRTLNICSFKPQSSSWHSNPMVTLTTAPLPPPLWLVQKYSTVVAPKFSITQNSVNNIQLWQYIYQVLKNSC